jgi:2,3-bisphosphoglycerate-dependent phosphoglycerate mutase
VRHGQSTWNSSGKFSGWVDIPLTEKGREEARIAGKQLKEQGFHFDIAYTSMLDRAIETCDLILEEM